MNVNKWVILSGYWNIGIAAFLLCPAFYKSFGLNLQQPLWGWLIAGFLLYTAATLILAGQDLRHYGTIVIYEALLRFSAAALLIPGGLWFGYGWLVVLLGLTDALWGYFYITRVPDAAERTLKQLLLSLL